MKKGVSKQASWSNFTGGLLKRLLEGFCSSAWLKACVTQVATENGLKMQINQSLYPPGGKDGTGMIYCSVCRRWTPRHGWTRNRSKQKPNKAPCLDCVTEDEVHTFVQHLLILSDNTLAWELFHLSWRRGSARRLIEQVDPEYSDTWEAYSPDTGEIESGYHKIGADYWHAFRNHERWVGKDTKSSPQAYNFIDEIIFPERQGTFSRRSFGCQVVLLDESEDRLRYEINYYLKNKRILPSSKQDQKINPFAY